MESTQNLARPRPRPNRFVAVNDRGLRIGEDHPRAVLTDHDVELMLELRGEGFSLAWLAEKFEVSKSCAAKVCSGRTRARVVVGHRRVLGRD